MYKKILLVMALFLLSTTSFGAAQFNDLDESWAKEEIMFLVEKDIVKGYHDHTFQPNKQMTVAEFFKILIESQQFPIDNHENNMWYQSYVDYLIKENIITESTFESYHQPINRIQAGKIVAKVLNLSIERYEHLKIHFTDWHTLTPAQQQYLGSLFHHNIFKGDQQHHFNPYGLLTREQGCMIIYNLLNSIKQPDKQSYQQISEQALKQGIKKEIIDENFEKLNLSSGYYCYKDEMASMIKALYRANFSLDNPTDYFFINHSESNDGILPGVSFAVSNSYQYFIKGNYNYLIKFYKQPIDLNKIWVTDQLSDQATIKIKINELNTVENTLKFVVDNQELNNYHQFYSRKLEKSLSVIFDNNSSLQILNYILNSWDEKNIKSLKRYSHRYINDYRIDRIAKGNLIFYVTRLKECENN